MPRGGGGGGRSGGGGGGVVHVSGYTRSNGTYVSGYTRSAPSSSSGGGYSGGGSVDVSGYTRSNGTYVSGYTRSAPSSTPSPKPRSSEGGSGRVQVSGYTRSDGTEVSAHTRTAPRTEYRNRELQKERGDTYSGKYKTQASHVVSVDEREEFDLPPESETLRNLRNQNEYTNLSVHKRIDNGLLRMWRKGEFCMDEINRGTPGDSSYISPQEVHDRIVQKIEVAKAQGDLQDPSFKEYLYKAADMADVDLRIFNGRQTERVSGGSPAAGGAQQERSTQWTEAGGVSGTMSDYSTTFNSTYGSVGALHRPLQTSRYASSRTPDPARRMAPAVSTSSSVVVKPEHFYKRHVFEGKDSKGQWWPIIIKRYSATRSDCYEVEVEDGLKQVWPVAHPANMRYAEEPPAGSSGGEQSQEPTSPRWRSVQPSDYLKSDRYAALRQGRCA